MKVLHTNKNGPSYEEPDQSDSHYESFAYQQKRPLIRGAVPYKTLTVSMRVLHHSSHAYPIRPGLLYYFVCCFGATVLATIALAMSRVTGRSKYIP